MTADERARIAAEKPRRVQLRRTRGWRMPENTVKVDRSTRWGNPFTVGELRPTPPDGRKRERTAEQAAESFRRMVADPSSGWREMAVRELRGKNLACWCPLDQPCHADVLLGLANGGDHKGGQCD